MTSMMIIIIIITIFDAFLCILRAAVCLSVVTSNAVQSASHLTQFT